MEKLNLAEISRAIDAEKNTDLEIFFDDIITDSRKVKKGALFVAIKGENFNGEDFAEEALRKGAKAILVSKDFQKNIDGIILKVDDTLTAYQQIAGIWRNRFDIPIVAITGSNGKTTTKDLTAAALSGIGSILKTSNNFNNEIGVPLTLLSLNNDHKAAVVEIGMRGIGQIKTLTQFVRPTIGIVTTVNETHIELLGSIENIARAKGELVEYIPSDGTIILNADNPHTAAMKNLATPNVKVITYGLENSADLMAEDIFTRGESTRFKLIYVDENFDFEIPMLGRHNVSNALAAIAAGLTLGLNITAIQSGISSLTATKMRFEIIPRDKFTIINDAYNASPASMKAAIHTVAEVYDGRRIAVLGDMLELGDIAEEAHRKIGAELVKNNFDTLITLGELGKFIAFGAREAGLKNIYSFDSHSDVAKKILSILQDGDKILFKASHGIHLEKVIDMI